jgi:alkylation response protein AidB-like acyl-CoA dehydrogenase
VQYQPPVNDLKFVLFDVLGVDQLQTFEKYAEASPDIMCAVIEEAGRLAAEVLQPLNKIGDQQGCTYDPQTRSVTTPDGFGDAYRQFTEAGWASLDAPVDYGGQGLPHTLKFIVDEMVCSCNLSLGMYAGLTHGAISALYAHGSQELKDIYLKNLVSGRWTGTMCLTEPQCGTDLGMVRTKAVRNDDGSFSITGQNRAATADAMAAYEQVMRQAKARDGQEGSPVVIDSSSWRDAQWYGVPVYGDATYREW